MAGPVSYTHLDVYKRQYLTDVAVQKMLEHRVAKAARAARDEQRFSLEIFCVHGL